jgi:hypothetical protein
VSGGWREAQEPVIRYVASAAFLGCAVGFCTTVGDVEAGTSIGLFFGLLFAAVPAGWLWGRELHEIQVRSDRSQVQQSTRSMGRLLDDEDDEPAQGRVVRPSVWADPDDD